MLKDELQLLFGQKAKSRQERKYLRIEYEELKEHNNALKKDFKRARSKGDFEAMADITNQLDPALEEELRQEVKGTIKIKFRNTSFELDKGNLKRLKNPDKYVNKLYFNKSLKQIDALIDKGFIKEAGGLIQLLEKSDNLKTDRRKEKEIERKINKLKTKLRGKAIKKGIDSRSSLGEGQEEGKLYDVIFITSGSVLTVTVI